MSGVMLGSSADAMQVEICSPFGVQQILIDPETGEPVSQTDLGQCEWCQSFGAIVDVQTRTDVSWTALNCEYQTLLPGAQRPHVPLRLAADFHSRAPPF